MNKIWDNETTKKFTELYPITTSDKLAEIFSQFSRDALRTKAVKLGLKKQEGYIRTNINGWSTEKINYLIENYDSKTAKEIAIHLNCTKGAIKNRITKLKLRKVSNNGCFVKGQVSLTKGRKMPSKGRAIETQFKKGHKPHNTKYDGCVQLRTNSKGYKYYWIRISEGNWKMLNVHLWEQIYGIVPAGYIVVFKDKNQFNCIVENLMIVTLEQNLRRNENREKQKASSKRYYDNGMSIDHVAGFMAYGNKELKAELLKHPELLELKRLVYKLNRQIKNHEQKYLQ